MTRDVLHLTPSVGPLAGGLGTVATALAGEQRQMGWSPRIWCIDSAAVAAEAASAIDLDGAIESMAPIGPRALAYSRAAERRARRTQFDVVHQHGLWTAQARLTTMLRERKMPTVVAPHGSLEPYAIRRSAWKKKLALALFERANLEHATCLHATADSELATFRDFGLRSPVAIIPNGVPETWLTAPGDGERFRRERGFHAEERILLFVSRIDPKKGLPMLVEALASVRHKLKGWRVVIAGQDEKGHRAEVESLAGRAGVVLDFLGPVFGEEKRNMFAAASLFVLPTRSDNFAIVIAEALGAGVPVITTHGAPWRELDTHGCGWWVRIDAGAIADAIVDAIGSDPGTLKEMGLRGRRLVSERYTWSAVAQRTVDLYRWLMREAGKPGFVVLD